VKSIVRRHISPALVISLIALFVSLGGVSYAVATGSIDSRELKDDDVRAVDIRDNALTGDDIAEARLGSVPSARKAVLASTVGGFTIQKFFTAPRPGSTPSEVFRGKDFVLKANCNSSRDPNLLLDGVRGVRPPNVMVSGSSFGNPDQPQSFSDSVLNPGDDIPLASPQVPTVGGTAIVSARNGRVTAIHFGAEGTAGMPFGRNVCSMRGIVITG
jgi:hypothetical protein